MKDLVFVTFLLFSLVAVGAPTDCPQTLIADLGRSFAPKSEPGKILIIEDEPDGIAILDRILRTDYRTFLASSGNEALAKIEEVTPDLIITDLNLPDYRNMEIFQLLKKINERSPLPIPIIVITGNSDFSLRINCLKQGASDFLCKPYSTHEVSARVHNIFNQKYLTRQLVHATDVIQSLINMIEGKDPYTHGHSNRVAKYASGFAKFLGSSKEVQDHLNTAGGIHDIGKIWIPDSILHKSSKLEPLEFELIKTHPIKGVELLNSFQFISIYLPSIRNHHERWDGKGYPDGLQGKQIPTAARLLAITDSFDAMTSTRPYRPGMPAAQALSILKSGANTQWDPLLVELFIDWNPETIRSDD